MTGELRVLNVGAGDITITFNNTDVDETDKALAMLQDMLKRGYLVAVQLPDGTYARARQIDPTRGRYIVTVPTHIVTHELPPAPEADLPELPPAPEAAAADIEQHLCACGCGAPVLPGKTWVKGHHKRKRAATQTVSVPVQKTKAVGVARSAGG